MRILLSAYACRPGQELEFGLGWTIVRQIAKHNEVWVLTHGRNQAAIAAELRRTPLPHVRFCYVDGQRWLPRWRPGPTGQSPGSYLWQIRAYLAARRLHAEVGFDVAHDVGQAHYAAPSLLALLPMPFVWGPLGGGESTPPSFRSGCDRPARAAAWLGALGRRIAEWDPWVRLTARRSTIVLAMTRDTAAKAQALGAGRVELRGGSGLCAQEIDALAGLPSPPEEPIRLISIGRMRGGSGLALGLRAFAAAALPGAEYWIVGDGPQRRRLRALARQAGIADRVRFMGEIARAEVAAVLRDCHLLLHPSLRDAGGWACLEAMAAGRPVVCLDLGAPALQVTDQVGVKVPAHTPEQAVRDLAAAVRRLAAAPELRHRLGEAGRARARRLYEWNARGRSLVHLYQQIATPARPAIARGSRADAHPGGPQPLSDPRWRGRIGRGGAGAPAPEWP
jgi:glycosyltransferase involved in cell wall biosynthesis